RARVENARTVPLVSHLERGYAWMGLGGAVGVRAVPVGREPERRRVRGPCVESLRRGPWQADRSDVLRVARRVAALPERGHDGVPTPDAVLLILAVWTSRDQDRQESDPTPGVSELDLVDELGDLLGGLLLREPQRVFPQTHVDGLASDATVFHLGR